MFVAAYFIYWVFFRLVPRVVVGLGRLVYRGISRAGNRIGAFFRKVMPHGAFRLTAFKDEKSSLFRSSHKKRVSPYKRMRWKDLSNDTDKVRFIYYFFMRKKIKKGFVYLPQQTPREQWLVGSGRWLEDTEELFDMYNDYRYSSINTDGEADRLQWILKK